MLGDGPIGATPLGGMRQAKPASPDGVDSVAEGSADSKAPATLPTAETSGAAFDAQAFGPGFQRVALATEAGEVITTEDGDPIQTEVGLPVPFSLDTQGAGLDQGAFEQGPALGGRAENSGPPREPHGPTGPNGSPQTPPFGLNGSTGPTAQVAAPTEPTGPSPAAVIQMEARGTVMSAGTANFSVGGNDAEMTVTTPRRDQAALPTVESVVARISENPSVFAALALDAARRIQASIDQLEASKPNEPDALDGYANINTVLTELKGGFETIANDLDEANTSALPTVKSSRIESAARAAMQIYDGFIGYYVENGGKAGHVLGKLFLTGTISGALTYFVGVPPAISFAVTAAAIEGENIWDAVKAFAPKTGKN